MRTLALLLFFICYTVAVFDPSPITVKDSHGNVLSSFRIQQHGEKQTLYPRIDAFPVTWSLAPEIKEVSMWVDGSIYVYMDTIIPKTTFTISASTSTGNYSLPFDIEVAGCEYGYFTFKGMGPFINLFSDSKLVYNGTTDSVYLCLPRGEYHFTSPETKAYYFSVFDDNNTHFYSTQYNGFGAPAQGSFSNDIDRPIELRIPPVISVLPSLDKLIYLDARGPASDISIEPEVRFNPLQYSIQLYTKKAVTNYTITATYGDRTVKATFAVYCGICPEDRTLVEVRSSSVSFALPTVETNAAYFYRQSFCVQGKSFSVDADPDGDGVILFSENGRLFYERRFVNETSSSFTVQAHSLLSFSSPSRSTSEPLPSAGQSLGSTASGARDTRGRLVPSTTTRWPSSAPRSPSTTPSSSPF